MYICNEQNRKFAHIRFEERFCFILDSKIAKSLKTQDKQYSAAHACRVSAPRRGGTISDKEREGLFFALKAFRDASDQGLSEPSSHAFLVLRTDLPSRGRVRRIFYYESIFLIRSYKDSRHYRLSVGYSCLFSAIRHIHVSAGS